MHYNVCIKKTGGISWLLNDRFCSHILVFCEGMKIECSIYIIIIADTYTDILNITDYSNRLVPTDTY